MFNSRLLIKAEREGYKMKKAIFNKLKIIFPLCALLALSNCIGLVGGYDIPEIIRIRSFYWNSINEFYICITISMQIFLLLVPMVNFYKKDFPTVVTYCITRNSNRKKWYYQKVSGLVTLSALTTIIYSCISLIRPVQFRFPIGCKCCIWSLALIF